MNSYFFDFSHTERDCKSSRSIIRYGNPICYAICKAGLYALSIFVAYQTALRSIHVYYFVQDLHQSNLISKPQIIGAALWQLGQDIRQTPGNMIKICGIYVLLYGGMHLSNPYEAIPSKIA